MSDPKVYLNGHPQEILMTGIQRDGIAVLIVRPAPGTPRASDACRDCRKTFADTRALRHLCRKCADKTI